MIRTLRLLLIAFGLAMLAGFSAAQDKSAEESKSGFDLPLAAGDMIRILVFQNPDLTLETRVSETGSISYPLIGTVQVGGLTIDAAEKAIAKGLRDGGFVQQPQVNISLVQALGNRVTVVGMVARPGRVPLENLGTRVTEILAASGGIAQGGSDTVVLTGTRNGKPFRKEIDTLAIYMDGKRGEDIGVVAGDVLYVHRAPMYYIYGEVQRPGSYRVERGMTVQQALAQAGGLSPRGTENSLRLHRADKEGVVVRTSPGMFDAVQANDVLFVRESLF